MSSIITNSDRFFSKQQWAKISVGCETGCNGLYKRKLADFMGSWRYDFYSKGKRYKGVIGLERDGWTLGAAKNA